MAIYPSEQKYYFSLSTRGRFTMCESYVYVRQAA